MTVPIKRNRTNEIVIESYAPVQEQNVKNDLHNSDCYMFSLIYITILSLYMLYIYI